MNLLILAHGNSSYSSKRPEAEIYIGLARAGHKVFLFTNKDRKDMPRVLEHGIKVIDYPYKSKVSVSAIKVIRKTIKENDIEIVYGMNSRNIPNAAFASIGCNVKLIVYRGTTGGLYRRDPTSYLSVLHPRVDGVVCVSHAVEKYVKTRVSSRVVKNVITIYKGHDLNWYTKPETDLTEFNTEKGNFNVACVVNARPHKGLIYAIRATKDLADLERMHLILVGKNIDKEPYLSEIRKSGMEDRIHTTGYRHDAPEIIAACDVLVLASMREGLPRVILESLAYKTPVVTSANEGSMEIIENEVNGYVVPLRDASAIADRLRHLYNNPEVLEELSNNCQKHFTAKFSSEETVAKHEIFFQSLLLGEGSINENQAS